MTDLSKWLNQAHCMDALELLAALPAGSVDCVITDPPYPEIRRDYGTLTEQEWLDLMYAVVRECRRVLKPSGSALFVLQPNFANVGKMRLWIWRFMLFCGEYWNIIQDAYWWNHAAMPTGPATQFGLMRSSVKPLVWIGEPDAYRNQDAVLWRPSDSTLAINKNDMSLHKHPSGMTKRPARVIETVERRGGTTPFNLLPIANTNSSNSAGSNGHGAGTPIDLVSWWIRYISPPGGIVLDSFCGSGTTAIAARACGRDFICGDSDAKYVDMARARLGQPYTLPMFV